MQRTSERIVLKPVNLVENGEIEILCGPENQPLSVINGNRYDQIKLDSLTIYPHYGGHKWLENVQLLRGVF